MGGFSTAVMAPTNRGFDITPPDPYANLKALALQGEAQQRQQEIAASKQTVAGQQQQMELTAQKIRDQQALAQTLREWTPSQSADDFVKKVIDNGGSGDAGLQAQQHFIDLHLKNTQLTEAQLKLKQAKHEQLASQVQTILDAKSPEEKLSRWTQYHPAMLGEIDEGETLPDGLPNDEYLQGLRNGHMLSSEISKQDLEKAQAGEAAARGKQAEAEAGRLSIEQELTKHKLDLYKTLTQTPQALEQRVAGSVNPQKYPDLFARTLNEARNQPDIDHINAAIEKGSQAVTEQERTIAVETNPAVRKARTQQALDIAEATNPLKLQEARASAMATSGVREALNLDQQYAKQAGATEALGKLLDATDTGNKAAGSALPVLSAEGMNAIFGIKRINKFDIDQAGGLKAGNIWDRITGWADHVIEGQPIPPNIRNDIRDLHQLLGENSYNTYKTSLDALSQRTGTDYKPTIQAPNIRKGAAPSAGKYNAGDTQVVNGKTYKRDAKGTWTAQ